MTYIRIETPARLHLGMFDISGTLGRRFGGIGVTVNKPALVLEARRSRDLTANGPDADRALEFATRYLAAVDLKEGAHLDIQQAIPHHSGLGSGTKLGLTVALALATLYDQPSDPNQLARWREVGAEIGDHDLATYRSLVSQELTPVQRERVATPTRIHPRQRAVLAVH